MTSVKVKFRPSAVSGKEGVVYYQVIKDRVVRQQKTSYRVYPSEWDPGRSSVAVPAAASDSRKDYLARVWQSVSDDLERLNAIVARCERHGCRYSAADVLAMFDARERSPLLFGFMRGVAARSCSASCAVWQPGSRRAGASARRRPTSPPCAA